MAQNINSVVLTGNLTRDPELRTTASGLSTCSFSLAVDGVKGKNGAQRTDYPTIVAWRQLAEIIVKYERKGDKIAVHGHLQTRSYEKNGERRQVTEIVAEQIEFLSKRRGNSDDDMPPEATPTGDAELPDADTDDLPF